ncbi:MAG: phage portal protein [Sedimentisphaerales bacterium]|nr:phage portal protein [Sedimentisphaerales bacterium]
MAFELEVFGSESIDAEFIEWLIEEKSPDIAVQFSKLWEYYTNRIIDTHNLSAADRKVNETGRCYVQAQEYGLPARITGLLHSAGSDIFGAEAVSDIQRKEVVIENDIAWRINAAVDFLFGKMISFASKSPDSSKREEIETIVKALFAANGGIGFFQDMAVLGGVYGFVDCIVKPGEKIPIPPPNLHRDTSKVTSFEDVLNAARAIDLELIEAPRALPVLDESDYRKIIYYIQHFRQSKNSITGKDTFLSRLVSPSRRSGTVRDSSEITEIISSDAWQRYEDRQLVSQGELPWGFLPVVHIQNIAQPYYYEGLSDVEPLMPLQDELNTRLSDRASRITFQSFKMYLGKGIEGFENRPVAPGRMWCTDNPDAEIEEFGGDAATPSEDLHIAEVREAMDKVSGVTPLVAGVIKNKLGNLTSAVALRLTLMGMLSKTERKRYTYSQGIKKMIEMAFSILDTAGIYKTKPAERDVEIVFQSPLPENVMEKLQEAQIKKELGVPTGQVLKELGYDTISS